MRKLKQMVVCLLLTVLLAGVLPAQTVEAATVKLSSTKVTLVKGESKTLKVSGTKSKVTWKSSKASVATVNSKGKVTAKAKGTATITAKVGSRTLKCKVTVETPKISKTSLSLDVKKTATLKVSGTTQKVKWSSSKTSVATVSSSGKVTAKKAGTATITAKVGTKKYTCKVTVKSTSTLSSNYKKLKNYITSNGATNQSGNKVIQVSSADTSGNNVTWLISYDKKKDKFVFGYQFQEISRLSSETYTVNTVIMMDVNVVKSSSVSPQYGLYVANEGVEAKATFKASSYTGNKDVKFTITSSTGGVSNDDIQKATNAYLKNAFAGWETLLKSAGVSMKKIGFTSYNPK